MTRDTVWQYDPPFAVGEAQIAPASSIIARLCEDMRSSPVDDITLITRPQLEMLEAHIKAEREQTIRECIEAVQDYGLKFSSHPDFGDALDALRSLLQSSKE